MLRKGNNEGAKRAYYSTRRLGRNKPQEKNFVVRRWFDVEAAKRQGAECTSNKAAWRFEAVLTQSDSGTQAHRRGTTLSSTTNLMIMTSPMWVFDPLDGLQCDAVRDEVC